MVLPRLALLMQPNAVLHAMPIPAVSCGPSRPIRWNAGSKAAMLAKRRIPQPCRDIEVFVAVSAELSNPVVPNPNISGGVKSVPKLGEKQIFIKILVDMGDVI